MSEEKLETNESENEQNKGPRELTKHEQDIMKKAHERHKNNRYKDQICWGKKFVGQSFISKPEKIVFKDFNVNKRYSEKIVLTNVSFTFNKYYFREKDLDPSIKDFFEIQYDPPGELSAGLTGVVWVHFTPKQNTPINSVLPFESKTGPFEIPIICLPKQTIIKVEPQIIDFKQVIMGESGVARMKITNDGALGSKFSIRDEFGNILPNFNSEQSISEIKSITTTMEANDVPQNQEDLTKLEQFLKQLKMPNANFIEGYNSITMSFKFSPTIIDCYEEKFLLVFENEDQINIPFTIKGECMDVPIYVEKQIYDFNICIFEHTYRDKIVLHNRSTHPMKIQLYAPKEAKGHIEFNPTLGYIQGYDKFEIWCKLRPSKTTPQILDKYLNEQEDTLQVPIKVFGANQEEPVRITIKFTLSINNITFEPPMLDFQQVYLHSASKLRFTMRNNCKLPQEFAFVRLPETIKIEPDDGFGTLLPDEELEMFAVYRPAPQKPGTELPKEQSQIAIKVKTGNISAREIFYNYKAHVILCPINISYTKFEFPSLPEGESQEVMFRVQNQSKKTLAYEIISPSFEESGLTINPVVIKNLQTNQIVQHLIKFESKFRKRIRNFPQEESKQEIQQEQSPQQSNQTPQQSAPQAGKKLTAKEQAELQKQIELQRQQEEELKRKQEELRKKQEEEKKLQEQEQKPMFWLERRKEIESEHATYQIPIFIAQVQTMGFKTWTPGETVNTFLEIRTTVVEKMLVAEETEHDFGEIAVAQRKIHELLIRNIGFEPASLSVVPLPPYCGFSILNALRTIEPGATHPVVVEFLPPSQQIFEERLVLKSEKSMVSVKLKGKGVRPELKVNGEKEIWMGHVLAGDQNEKSLQLQNVSSFALEFQIQKKNHGRTNKSGQNVFSFIPQEANMAANKELDLTVRFAPDHQSQHFFAHVLIYVPNQVTPQDLYIAGNCWSRQLFVKIDAPFKRPTNWNMQVQEPLDFMDQVVEGRQKIILIFRKNPGETEYENEQMKIRKLQVGSCQLNDPKLSKPGTVEFIMPKQETNYFSIDKLKENLNPGSVSNISFTFNAPPIDSIIEGMEALKGVGQWVEQVIEGKLQGGYVPPGQTDPLIFEVVLRAYVTQI